MQQWCHQIRLNSLFQKTPSITAKNGTIQPGNAFEDIHSQPVFDTVKL
jgi:hypothetical protein